MEWNLNFLFIYPLPALLTSLPFIPFTTEKIIGCTNEAAKGAIKAEINPPSCFFFRVLLFHQYHQLMHLNLLILLCS